MKSGIRHSFFFLVMVGLTGWSNPAAAESFARVSDIRGSLTLNGGDEGSWVDATLNLLLREDDRLRTGAEATAEMEMPGLARVRMGSRTEIRMVGFGDQDRRDEIVLENGGVFVDDRNGSTVIETLSAAVSPNSGSVLRVDADREGTRVRVSLGSAQIQTFEDGQYSERPLLIRSGEEMVLDVGAPPKGPYVFTAANDRLDRYTRERGSDLGQAGTGRSLEQPLMGSDELDRYGEWVTVSGSAVWRPRVGADWRPYSVGYWSWYDPYGWTWISYEPWGYATFHYGGWLYDSFYGWCWYPGYTWRPAYVSWVAVGPYYAWAPLNPWGQVVVIRNVVVVNRIDRRVFTAAPRTAFDVGPRSIRAGRGRIIPHEMRDRNVIRAADNQVFSGDRKIEPIKNFNAAQPVKLERGLKDQRTTTAASRESRPGRGPLPVPGRTLMREGRSPAKERGAVMPERRANVPPPQGKEQTDRSRSRQEMRGPSGQGEAPARTERFPRVDRPNRGGPQPEIHKGSPGGNRGPQTDQGATQERGRRGGIPREDMRDQRGGPGPAQPQAGNPGGREHRPSNQGGERQMKHGGRGSPHPKEQGPVPSSPGAGQ